MQTLIYMLRFQRTRDNAIALLDYLMRHPTADALLTVRERQEVEDLIHAALPGRAFRSFAND